jgi:hypothetical protein
VDTKEVIGDQGREDAFEQRLMLLREGVPGTRFIDTGTYPPAERDGCPRDGRCGWGGEMCLWSGWARHGSRGVTLRGNTWQSPVQ